MGMESLEACLIKADLLYVYKILFNLVDVDSAQLFLVIGYNRGSCLQIVYKLLLSKR